MDNIKSKNLVMIAHCIINQNSVVEPLARAKGAFSFVKELIESGVGIIQLSCPEFRHLGITRKPMDKIEYNTPEYRNLCRKLFEPVLEDLLVYLENDYKFIGIIGINQSPSCSISGTRGVFMEEIFDLLSSKGIEPNYFEIPENYEDAVHGKEIYESLKKALKIYL
jgi:predicted secreted protein